MKYIFFIFIQLSSSIIYSQYVVNTFYDDYVEITDYKSVAIETFGDIYWDKNFELPFVFPCFDTTVTSININHEGIGKIENDIESTFRLMAFGYTFDNVLDTIDIKSDVRYQYGQKDGKNYLVTQFTKNRLFSDTSIEEYDSHVNFQYWFFDDGSIEVRIGPSNLDNSPVYVPGEGFYLLTDQGPIPAGPQLALYHPFDINIQLTYNDFGNHEEYELALNQTESVDWWPTEGWVIQFKNQLVATNDIESKASVNIYPNPARNTIHIESEDAVNKINIYDMMGHKNLSFKESKNLDISILKKGFYQMLIHTNSNIINRKFLKL